MICLTDIHKGSGPDEAAPLIIGVFGCRLLREGDLKGLPGGAEEVDAGGEGGEVCAGRRPAEEDAIDVVDVLGCHLFLRHVDAGVEWNDWGRESRTEADRGGLDADGVIEAEIDERLQQRGSPFHHQRCNPVSIQFRHLRFQVMARLDATRRLSRPEAAVQPRSVYLQCASPHHDGIHHRPLAMHPDG